MLGTNVTADPRLSRARNTQQPLCWKPKPDSKAYVMGTSNTAGPRLPRASYTEETLVCREFTTRSNKGAWGQAGTASWAALALAAGDPRITHSRWLLVQPPARPIPTFRYKTTYVTHSLSIYWRSMVGITILPSTAYIQHIQDLT